MAIGAWTRYQLLVAFGLYIRLPHRRFRETDPDIIRFSETIGRSPASLKMKLWNIASIDPAIKSAGRRSLLNASASDRAMWNEMQEDWERFAVQCEQALAGFPSATGPLFDLPESGIPRRLGMERLIETTARVGQSFFRSAIMSAYEGACCITGLSVPGLLVASHIVPWSVDERNRVNPRNGLLLSALHDKAFDGGLLTIDDEFIVRISSSSIAGNDKFFADTIRIYEGKTINLPEKFEPEREFLCWHREHVFLK